MTRTSLFLATALALAAGPALAQSSTGGTHATAASTTTHSGQFLTQEGSGEFRASQLKGLDVYNNANEKLGDIRDVLVDASGQVKAVVIGVGGFLGLGDHDVAVPFNQLHFVNSRNTNTAANTNAGNTTAGGNNTMSTDTRNGATGTNAANAGLGSPAVVVPGNTAASTGTMATSGRAGMPDHATLNATRDQLKAAPAFKWNHG